MRPIDADLLFGKIEEMDYIGTTDNENDTVVSCRAVLDIIDYSPTLNIPHWIKCTEKMPNESIPVLIIGGGHRVTAYYDRIYDVLRLTEDELSYYQKDIVTHWMPLPEVPQDD